MGLTKQSVGMGAVDSGLEIKKQTPDDKIIAIAGNPNVGKSTLFNNLTGMNQHTGNWPGKTVTNAQGYCKTKEHSYVLVDIPGTYSLMAHSSPPGGGEGGPQLYLFWRKRRGCGCVRRHLPGAQPEPGTSDHGNIGPGPGMCEPDGRSRPQEYHH